MASPPGLNILLAYKGWRGASRAGQLLDRELAAGREHPGRARERLGESRVVRPKGPLVWFHARNDTEALAIPELIERLASERDDAYFLITTALYDADMALSSRLPTGVIHQFLPYEVGPGFQTFLDYWQPDVAIWSDSDLRPRIIEAISNAEIPLFMVNARLSDDRLQRWRWFPGIARALLRRFTQILVVDDRTDENLRRLGVPAEDLEVLGLMQEGSAPLPCLQSERDALGDLLAARPVWLATDVHIDEEDIVIAAHRRVTRRAHRLLLILSPNDPDRGPELADRLEQEGWVVTLRSRDEEPDPEVQIFVADLPDEMGLWFRLSPIAFLGGSLTNGGGGNPYEATALGSAVLSGPRIARHRESFERLQQVGAARTVQDTKTLAQEVERLLAPDKAAEMAAAAWEVSTRGAAVTDRISQLVHEVLDTREMQK